MITFSKDKNKDFIILNLTDTQLGDDEWNEPRFVEIFTKTVEKLVSKTKPDLITVSGDIAYAGQTVAYEKFGSYMENLNIPWSVVFGNHDNQGGPEIIQNVVSILRKYENFVFEEGDPAYGCGNFVISVEEGKKPVFSLVMVDSHDRDRHDEPDGEVWMEWAKLPPEHINWIDGTLTEIEDRGCPESAVLLHIPIYSYRYAADAAFAGDRSNLENSACPDFWNEGYKDSSGVMREDICSSWKDEGTLDMFQKHPSIKAIIAGHDHVNNFMITYRGVRHIYALKTGIGSYSNEDLNGGTVIKVGEKVDIYHEYVSI